MSWSKPILQVMLLTCVMATTPGLAQSTDPNPQQYTLINGSQLVDDCPVCGRPTILVPLTGTFTLTLLDQNPLYTRYELSDIFFQGGSKAGLEYKVTGKGTYQIGGEVALLQDLFLDVAIENGYATTQARCVNTNRAVYAGWPKIAISVDQTNGTPTQVYYLTLVAVPVPKLVSFPPDPHSGSIHLEWSGNGGSFQVERGLNIGGPFLGITPITTNTSFTDVGVLSTNSQVFYRLQQF